MESNSVCNIIVVTKSDDRAAGDGIGRHEVFLPINLKNFNFRGKKKSQVMKEKRDLY